MQDILESALKRIGAAQTIEELESVRVEMLGRKGVLAQFSKELGKLAPDERASRGKLINSAKQALETAYEGRKSGFERTELANRLDSEWLDLTVPAPGPRPGSL